MHLPGFDRANQVFFSNDGAWHTWTKPRNAKIVNFLLLGGGGAGAGGGSGSSGTTRSGGAGGGSSAIARGTFPASLLPDTLYIQVGKGGTAGSAGNGNGGAGSLSYVCVQPNTLATSIILASGAATAGGGTGSATGGIAGTVFSQTAGILSYLGTISLVAGQAGVAGGTNVAGTSISLTLPISAGAGGGSANTTSYVGGDITGAGIIPTISGGATGGTNPGGFGYMSMRPSELLSSRVPMFFTGGSGGGSFNTGVGGPGGEGAFGSGGGGGGGGTTGGIGGKGGDGIVIITCS